ncbi:hypothetical protein K2173_022180 [Erythroxylum novogranatense]|uniref:Uncharacterized protein n=1 Tax=Erythroxylum novogranatense TaxID=1862640 RepID=A0AAV8TWQ7_9ROSI|nr:hypothetical protein K2173_022180 [Erythroxylum novogranatense]
MPKKKPKGAGVKMVEESSPSSSGMPSVVVPPPAQKPRVSLKTGKGVLNEVLTDQVSPSSSDDDSEVEATGGATQETSELEESDEEQQMEASPLSPTTASPGVGVGVTVPVDQPLVGSGKPTTDNNAEAPGSGEDGPPSTLDPPTAAPSAERPIQATTPLDEASSSGRGKRFDPC